MFIRWTHARDPITGEEYFLNTHGNGGPDGTVTPQPIDMVFTRPQQKCDLSESNCTRPLAFNDEPYYYIASPPRALAIAWTGNHIFVREWLQGFMDGSHSGWFSLIEMTLGSGALLALFASYFQQDA